MKSVRGIFLFLILLALLGLAFYSGRLLARKLKPVSPDKISELQSENIRLKSELEKFKGEEESEYLGAWVYSRYPFTIRELLILDKGSEQGAEEGMPVVTEENVLVGKIKAVRKNQSEVQTIFDPNWKSSVAIRNIRNKALLKGGGTPQVELIPQDIQVSTGDVVFNISEEIPIFVPVGRVKEVVRNPDEPWFSVSLETTYEPGSLDRVFIITEFP